MPGDITELYTWTEIDPTGGEGTIACIIPSLPHLGILNLVTRGRVIAEGPMGDAAREHHRRSGHRVRLVRWTAREDLQDLPAKE